MPNRFNAKTAYQRCHNFIGSSARRCIEYIKHQLEQHEANKKNESPQDRAARRSANATFWIASFTLVTVIVNVATYKILSSQLDEMRSSSADSKRLISANAQLAEATRNSADTAAKALAASRRAWVGPLNSNLSAGDIGSAVRSTVTYVNTGPEPAKFAGEVDEFVYSRDNWLNDNAATEISVKQANCFKISVVGGARFAWPSNGVATYELRTPPRQIPQIGAVVWTPEIKNGASILVVQGCFAYESLNKIRHTSFCYYYDVTETNISHLSICNVGNAAD